MSYSNEPSTVKNLWPDELKILIIDDNQDILNLIRHSLELAGFRIIRTTKPEEGLDLARREKPDLIILDIMMPRIDGIELLRRVRRHPQISKTPVIVVSARASSVDQLRMLQVGLNMDSEIDAFIGKPFNPTSLLQTVKNVLLKHRDFLLAKKHNKNIYKASAATLH